MSGRRGRGLADEERVLWAAVTRTIAPLKPERRRAAIDDATAAAAPSPTRKTAPASPQRPSAAKPVPLPLPPPLAPLDRRLRKRVAKGRDAIDGRLDLHGLTQAEAHAALSRFLNAAVAREARLVLIITGKGSRDGGGVLRRQVPLWLALPELRALVIGFEPAHAAHGGDGALYVRLRRLRGSS